MSFLGSVGSTISTAFRQATGIGTGNKKANIVGGLIGGAGYRLVSSMFKGGGGTPLDKWIKPLTPGGKSDAQKEADSQAATQSDAARVAAHDAEVARLAQGSFGAVALRRRRGSAATMLTGSPMMGSSPVSTGKTLLSQ